MQDDRYSRQTRFRLIGEDGQAQIARAHVAIVGCGALGTLAAEMLGRAGVAELRLLDRDFVEWSNLQRQTLFTEADAAHSLPKVIAAQQHLAAINSSVKVDAQIADVQAQNIAALLTGVDLIIDATDNFITRHLINEYACQQHIPWIYAACVGAYACGMTIIPGRSACLACIQDQLPSAGDSPTCDSSGIIAPAVYAASARQGAEALKILSGHSDQVDQRFWSCDMWQGTQQYMDLSSWRHSDCPACGESPSYPYLQQPAQSSISLCGRSGMQVQLPQRVDLTALAEQLGTQLQRSNAYLVRWQDADLTATCFADGRVIVQGSQEESQVRAFLNRWIG